MTLGPKRVDNGWWVPTMFSMHFILWRMTQGTEPPADLSFTDGGVSYSVLGPGTGSAYVSFRTPNGASVIIDLERECASYPFKHNVTVNDVVFGWVDLRIAGYSDYPEIDEWGGIDLLGPSTLPDAVLQVVFAAASAINKVGRRLDSVMTERDRDRRRSALDNI